jgi:sterol desaturase/sphingolipid hydroxylase (fatty acid hydroxylase superfamily)
VSLALFFWISAAVQLLFLGLDLADRHATRKHRYGGEPLRLSSFVFLLGVIALFMGIQVAGFALVPRVDALIDRARALVGSALPSSSAPHGVALLFLAAAIFHVQGFVDYAWHRWFSHHRLFWFTHESHHLPSEIFVGMPGLGVRPFAVLTVVPVVACTAVITYAALWLLGLPLWSWTIFQGPLLLSSTLLVTSHSSFMRRGWLAHRVLAPLRLTTPQEHALHHAVNLQGNYGNFTTLYDRLLGTYLDPRLAEHRDPRFGLAYDRDFLGAISAGALRIPAPWRRRFQVGRYCNIEP